MILSQLACRKLARGCPDRRLTRSLRECRRRGTSRAARHVTRQHPVGQLDPLVPRNDGPAGVSALASREGVSPSEGQTAPRVQCGAYGFGREVTEWYACPPEPGEGLWRAAWLGHDGRALPVRASVPGSEGLRLHGLGASRAWHGAITTSSRRAGRHGADARHRLAPLAFVWISVLDA